MAKNEMTTKSEDQEGTTITASFRLPQGERNPQLQSKLLEIPLDVLFEIFYFLEPLDLLHLARTGKDLRALLMNRTSAWIWRKTRSNIFALPECPPDLSESQYADWAFGNWCHTCFKTRKVHATSNARERICLGCLEKSTRYRKTSERPCRPEEMSAVLEFLPSITVEKPKSYVHYFDLEVDKQWAKEYELASDKEEWCDNKIMERRLIVEHNEECEHWEGMHRRMLEVERLRLIKKRESVILDHIKAMGWDKELAQMSIATFGFRTVESLFEVEQACKNEITDHVLLELEPFLVKCMTDFRNLSARQERRRILEERLPILLNILLTYNLTLPVNSTRPDIADIFSHPDVQNLIINTPSGEFTLENQMDQIFSMLPDVYSQWQAAVTEKLYSLITSACGDSYVFDKDNVLDLATTVFSCSDCKFPLREAIRYPRVMVHSCATLAKSYASSSSGDLEVISAVTSRMPWNRYGRITFKEVNMRVLSDVVVLAGLDPRTATASEMDALDPIFECLTCNDPSKGGRALMRWGFVPTHNRDYHIAHCTNTPPLNLRLLDEPEAVQARISLDAVEKKKRDTWTFDRHMCSRCQFTGTLRLLYMHLEWEHMISEPTDGDITFSSDPPCFHELLRVST